MNQDETVQEALKRARSQWGDKGWLRLSEAQRRAELMSGIVAIISCRSDSPEWKKAGQLCYAAMVVKDI